MVAPIDQFSSPTPLALSLYTTPSMSESSLHVPNAIIGSQKWWCFYSIIPAMMPLVANKVEPQSLPTICLWLLWMCSLGVNAQGVGFPFPHYGWWRFVQKLGIAICHFKRKNAWTRCYESPKKQTSRNVLPKQWSISDCSFCLVKIRPNIYLNSIPCMPPNE